jgi:elongation factor 1-beta
VGKVAVTLRIMPESPEVDLAELEELVKKRIRVHSITQEPIAFGLKALRVVTSVEDAAGGTEPLEKELASLPGVGSVQVTGLTRVLEIP